MSDVFRTRATEVLKCLLEYKRTLINKNTLLSQNPSDLENNVKPELNEMCSTLTKFMIYRSRPLYSDDDLQTCMLCLEAALNPWDMDLSILAPKWCEMIFKSTEFNLSDDIITEIINISIPPVDGQDEENNTQQMP
jgi:hypothetical protein